MIAKLLVTIFGGRLLLPDQVDVNVASPASLKYKILVKGKVAPLLAIDDTIDCSLVRPRGSQRASVGAWLRKRQRNFESILTKLTDEQLLNANTTIQRLSRPSEASAPATSADAQSCVGRNVRHPPSLCGSVHDHKKQLHIHALDVGACVRVAGAGKRAAAHGKGKHY